MPIDPLLPRLVAELKSGTRVVLRAAPGAGKTTRVPPALLDSGIAGAREIVVLEPRRIAARAAAEFVASERGGRIGDEVGYRVRFETRGSDRTRLWFVTEGLFSRRLLTDPYLDDVGVIVLDEFHERRLAGDVALGIVRELQETVRPDLRLVVMSATLDTEPLADSLGRCTVLTSEGREFPVAVEYLDRDDPRQRPAARVAGAVRGLLASSGEGDVLVFLPGAGSIRRVGDDIAEAARHGGADVIPLHGDLPLEAQRRALVPGPRRKIVLATNVAETSLTIEGITTVVDSGLAREARFDPRHGLNRLEEVRISRASAEQRAGRAGRTAAGRCLRLWSRADHEGRRERETPECLRLDLSATVLELRAWGVRNLRAFAWLDPPPEAALAGAERLLGELGAVGRDGAVTEVGRRMLELSVAPRLARMLVEAERRGCAHEGALLAALASERDVLLERRALHDAAGAVAWPSGPSDLLLRADLFREAERAGFAPERCRRLGLDPGALRSVERARRQLARAAAGQREATPATAEVLLCCVVAGFPDRVARRRTSGSPRAVMTGGKGVVLEPESVVRDAELFVAIDLEAGPRRERSEARVRAASAARREWLEEMFPDSIFVEREIGFDAARGRVVERRIERYGDLVLDEDVRTDVDALRAGEHLAAALQSDPALVLSDHPEVFELLGRLDFLAAAMPEVDWPDRSQLLDRTLEASACGMRSVAEVRRADLAAILCGLLDRETLRLLDRDAPGRFRLPGGRLARVHYARDRPPRISARIQELFGLRETPRMAAGRVAVQIEILAPNQRPVQVTDDLASFWERTYPEVRKQLRGRYPKHAWPEHPLGIRAGG